MPEQRIWTRWGEVIVPPNLQKTGYENWLYPPDHPVMVAYDAILELADYDMYCLEQEEKDAIYLAVLDAEPDGRDAQNDAAVATLWRLACSGGWDDILLEIHAEMAKDEEEEGNAPG